LIDEVSDTFNLAPAKESLASSKAPPAINIDLNHVDFITLSSHKNDKLIKNY
jgi:hypothetical protein